jgi:hypothetical protein
VIKRTIKKREEEFCASAFLKSAPLCVVRPMISSHPAEIKENN